VTRPENKRHDQRKVHDKVHTWDTPSVPNFHNLAAGGPIQENTDRSGSSAARDQGPYRIKSAPDGAILNCTAIPLFYSKLGRVTIPPTVVFALNGSSAPSIPVKSPSRQKEPERDRRSVSIRLQEPRNFADPRF
jgi:hypothetical protein